MKASKLHLVGRLRRPSTAVVEPLGVDQNDELVQKEPPDLYNPCHYKVANLRRVPGAHVKARRGSKIICTLIVLA